MSKKIKSCIILFSGIIIGILIDSLLRYKFILNISGEQFGSVAEWFGGIASTATVITSLWLALRKKTNIKVYHSLQENFVNNSKRMIPNTLSINFIAYNQGNKPVSLEFYGLRLKKKDDFLRPSKFKKGIVKPGESQEHKFNVSDLIEKLNLKEYKGKIEVGFAEPNGDLHTERFRWGDFDVRYKGWKKDK